MTDITEAADKFADSIRTLIGSVVLLDPPVETIEYTLMSRMSKALQEYERERYKGLTPPETRK